MQLGTCRQSVGAQHEDGGVRVATQPPQRLSHPLPPEASCGTLGYIAPEVGRGGPLNARALLQSSGAEQDLQLQVRLVPAHAFTMF